MYFLMVDRFVNGDKDNDEPVNDPDILPMANHFGGDLQGVAAKVEEAYFEDLGMNTVWISPITQNAKALGVTGKTAHGRTSRASSAGTTATGPSAARKWIVGLGPTKP